MKQKLKKKSGLIKTLVFILALFVLYAVASFSAEYIYSTFKYQPEGKTLYSIKYSNRFIAKYKSDTNFSDGTADDLILSKKCTVGDYLHLFFDCSYNITLRIIAYGRAEDGSRDSIEKYLQGKSNLEAQEAKIGNIDGYIINTKQGYDRTDIVFRNGYMFKILNLDSVSNSRNLKDVEKLVGSIIFD